MNKKYKTEEQKSGFGTGLLTMLLCYTGFDLFKAGSWMTYLGLFFIILATVNTWAYTR